MNVDLLHGRLEVAEIAVEVRGKVIYGPPKQLDRSLRDARARRAAARADLERLGIQSADATLLS